MHFNIVNLVLMLRLKSLHPIGLFEDLSYKKGLARSLTKFRHVKNSKAFASNKQCFRILREKIKNLICNLFFFYKSTKFLYLSFEYIASIGVLCLALQFQGKLCIHDIS